MVLDQEPVLVVACALDQVDVHPHDLFKVAPVLATDRNDFLDLLEDEFEGVGDHEVRLLLDVLLVLLVHPLAQDLGDLGKGEFGLSRAGVTSDRLRVY